MSVRQYGLSKNSYLGQKTHFLGSGWVFFSPTPSPNILLILDDSTTLMELVTCWIVGGFSPIIVTTREVSVYLFFSLCNLNCVGVLFVSMLCLVCIFITHGVVWNFLYKSLLMFILFIFLSIWVWVAIDIYGLNQDLGWMSIRL